MVFCVHFMHTCLQINTVVHLKLLVVWYVILCLNDIKQLVYS